MNNTYRRMILDRLTRAIEDKEDLTLDTFIQSLPLPSWEVIPLLKGISKEFLNNKISLSPELAKLIADLLSEDISRLKQIFVNQQILNKFFEDK